MLSLAVQVHISTPKGPILVQCIPCTAILSVYLGIFVKANLLMFLSEEYLLL